MAQSTQRKKPSPTVEVTPPDADARQIEQIGKAVEKADRGGPFVEHEAIAQWLDGWGSDNEQEPPVTTVRR